MEQLEPIDPDVFFHQNLEVDISHKAPFIIRCSELWDFFSVHWISGIQYNLEPGNLCIKMHARNDALEEVP